MKFRVFYLVSLMLFFCEVVKAEIITSYGVIDTNISFDECISRSKLARLELFEDDFGESVLDYYYSYLNDNVSITVACLEEKQMVMLFVATQGGNPVFYLRKFQEHIKGKPPVITKSEGSVKN